MMGSTAATGAISRLGPARYERIEGLHVLKLQGSPYERGLQHGRLLRDAVPRGPIQCYAGFVERLLREAGVGFLTPAALLALRAGVGNRVKRRLPAFVTETIRGLATGAGLPLTQIMDAAAMPDTLMWLAARAQTFTKRATAHRLALGLGCSSAVAWGEATKSGELLHGRNFDYHGVGSWDKEAAVIFHKPDHGLRYVSVASAGVPLGGATAMNEAGLTLAVHQHMFTDGTQLGGMPVGVVGDVIMREAENLDQAQALLDGHTPIGCWTYIIADGKSSEVLCYEENPKRSAAMRFGQESGEQHFRYANIFLDAELGKTEKDLYGSYWRANRGRYERLEECLRERRGELDPQAIAELLGDTEPDTGCRLRAPIAMLMTVGSVVMSPADQTLWVATGEAPVSRNRYLPFSLATEELAPERGELLGGDGDGGEADRAFTCYRDAFLAYSENGDISLALELVSQAAEIQPAEAVYHFVSGLLSLKSGSAASAERFFSTALDLGHRDPERVAGFVLFQARARDLCGRRGEAVEGYRRVLEFDACDRATRNAARRGIRCRFRPRAARRLGVEFAYGDVVNP